jgi:hypothetical protein
MRYTRKVYEGAPRGDAEGRGVQGVAEHDLGPCGNFTFAARPSQNSDGMSTRD